MADSAEKRQRDRKKREKKKQKAERKLERKEAGWTDGQPAEGVDPSVYFEDDSEPPPEGSEDDDPAKAGS